MWPRMIQLRYGIGEEARENTQATKDPTLMGNKIISLGKVNAGKRLLFKEKNKQNLHTEIRNDQWGE